MSRAYAFVALLLFASAAAAAATSSANERPVLIVSPTCVDRSSSQSSPRPEPIPITVRYDTGAPGAKLRAPTSLGMGVGISSDEPEQFPFKFIGNGVWQADVAYQPFWSYAMLLPRDAKGRIDDNSGQYWDVLTCWKGIPEDLAVRMKARSYAGEILGAGVQRTPDFARAVAILRERMQQMPDEPPDLPDLWRFELQRDGETAEAYAKLSNEILEYLDAHHDGHGVLFNAASFIFSFRERIDPKVVAKLMELVRQRSKDQALQEHVAYQQAQSEPESGGKITTLLDFTAKYPQSDMRPAAFAEAFSAARQARDVAAMRSVFGMWSAAEADNPDAYASMGTALVESSPQEALTLLAHAQQLLPAKPAQGLRFIITVGVNDEHDRAEVHYQMARAYFKLDNAVRAREEAAAALSSKAFARNADGWVVLGQSWERAGDYRAAADAYLNGVAALYAPNAGPPIADVKRVWAEGKLGSPEDAEREIAKRLAERRAKIVEDYHPVLLSRTAPPLTFTDISGKRYDSAAFRSRMLVVNFWATWCAPCLPELSQLQEYQRRHPEVTVIAIAKMSEQEKVRKVMREQDIRDIVVALSDDIANRFGGVGVPSTFIVDPNGNIRVVHSGAPPEIEAVLDKDFATIAAVQ